MYREQYERLATTQQVIGTFNYSKKKIYQLTATKKYIKFSW